MKTKKKKTLSLYVAIHNHRFGVTAYPFYAAHFLSEQTLVEKLGIDFEPQYEESIEIDGPKALDKIPTIKQEDCMKTGKELFDELVSSVSNLAFDETATPPMRRFVALERWGGETSWIITADTLANLQREINESETERDDVQVYDLETGLFHPVTFTAHVSNDGYET